MCIPPSVTTHSCTVCGDAFQWLYVNGELVRREYHITHPPDLCAGLVEVERWWEVRRSQPEGPSGDIRCQLERA